MRRPATPEPPVTIAPDVPEPRAAGPLGDILAWLLLSLLIAAGGLGLLLGWPQ